MNYVPTKCHTLARVRVSSTHVQRRTLCIRVLHVSLVQLYACGLRACFTVLILTITAAVGRHVHQIIITDRATVAPPAASTTSSPYAAGRGGGGGGGPG